MPRLPPPLSVTLPPPSIRTRVTTRPPCHAFLQLCVLHTTRVFLTLIVTGSGPQSKVMSPPERTALASRAYVHELAVPVPTTFRSTFCFFAAARTPGACGPADDDPREAFVGSLAWAGTVVTSASGRSAAASRRRDRVKGMEPKVTDVSPLARGGRARSGHRGAGECRHVDRGPAGARRGGADLPRDPLAHPRARLRPHDRAGAAHGRPARQPAARLSRRAPDRHERQVLDLAHGRAAA